VRGEKQMLFTGHVKREPRVSSLLKAHKVVLLVRDPYDYVLANARYFYSAEMADRHPLPAFLQEKGVPFNDTVTYLIAGGTYERGAVDSVQETFLRYALMWLDRADLIVRYEDIIKYIEEISTPGAMNFFSTVLSPLGLDLPYDWRARVLAGSVRDLSTTDSSDSPYRNIRHLTTAQRALFRAVAPELRAVLGYE
jgi:hypothetical protein